MFNYLIEIRTQRQLSLLEAFMRRHSPDRATSISTTLGNFRMFHRLPAFIGWNFNLDCIEYVVSPIAYTDYTLLPVEVLTNPELYPELYI